jgi:hypothetical protein
MAGSFGKFHADDDVVHSLEDNAIGLLFSCSTRQTSPTKPHEYQCVNNITSPMFSRLNQVARHLTRPLPNYAHRSSFAGRSSTSIGTKAMEENKRLIQTAACLIIGDEVLGGKVCSTVSYTSIYEHAQHKSTTYTDIHREYALTRMERQ